MFVVVVVFVDDDVVVVVLLLMTAMVVMLENTPDIGTLWSGGKVGAMALMRVTSIVVLPN